MNLADLNKVAEAMVAPGRGILAAVRRRVMGYVMKCHGRLLRLDVIGFLCFLTLFLGIANRRFYA